MHSDLLENIEMPVRMRLKDLDWIFQMRLEFLRPKYNT